MSISLSKLKLELYVQDEDVDSVMKTICDSARTASLEMAGSLSAPWRNRAKEDR